MRTDDPWKRLLNGKQLIAVAGAGGKKSTMYAIASQYSGRTGITTTVNCPLPRYEQQIHLVIRDEDGLMKALRKTSRGYRQVFFARPGKHPDRAAGIQPSLVTRIHEAHLFDTILVKADGARHRLIKAPAQGEPVYPPETEMVLYLVSAHVLGRKLSTGIAHRIEEFMAVTGMLEGMTIGPEHIVKLLASEAGALKGVEPGTCIVPVINRVDSPARYRQAHDIAEQVLSRTPRINGVALARMGEATPWIELRKL